MSVLSDRDLEFFDENGYVVARQAVSREQAEETARAVWAFAQKDPDDPGTWYAEAPPGPAGPDGPGVPARKGTIMIEIYHHQTLWNNRTAPRVHRAFSQIFGSEKLWVSHDRASINPPSRDPGEQEKGLHWDADLEDRPVDLRSAGRPLPERHPRETGGLRLRPGFHRKLEDWPRTSASWQQELRGGRPSPAHRGRSRRPDHLAARPCRTRPASTGVCGPAWLNT